MKRNSVNMSYSEMPADKLGLYIMDVQQPYLQKNLAMFFLCSKTIINKDEIGSKILGDVLQKLGALIEKHFEQDTHLLFPYLKSIFENSSPETINGSPLSFKKIKAEHQSIIKLFNKLRLLSNDYTPSLESTPGVKLCFAQLFNFEQDMLKHIFIEEDILFPKLTQMYKLK